MKSIVTLLHLVAALGFAGCSKEQKVESLEDPIYYLISGNVSDNFDSVELNQPSFGGAGAAWHEANGKKRREYKGRHYGR